MINPNDFANTIFALAAEAAILGVPLYLATRQGNGKLSTALNKYLVNDKPLPAKD